MALIGFFTGVSLPVFNEVGALAESLAALFTFVRFLPCVNPLVPDEVGPVTKGFSTEITFVGFL